MRRLQVKDCGKGEYEGGVRGICQIVSERSLLFIMYMQCMPGF